MHITKPLRGLCYPCLVAKGGCQDLEAYVTQWFKLTKMVNRYTSIKCPETSVVVVGFYYDKMGMNVCKKHLPIVVRVLLQYE